MAEIGEVLLVVALGAAVLAVAAGLLALRRPGQRAARIATAASRSSALAAVGALGVLAHAFAVGDHSLVAVVDHSRDGLGTYDRVMGLWGGMAGSLLLFTAATATFAAVGLGRRPHPVAVAASSAVVAALAAVTWLLADPFETLAIPALDGAGLTPILEHWAMRIHPPLVYAGMTVLIAPAARTMAALADRRLDAAWWSAVRPWLLASWGLLGTGMVIGAHWAYVELGWGGYWAWDPVENAALLPWLAVTVALHCRPVHRPRLGAALTLLPFVLAVLGTTMTRSGATTSVHAFAEAASIGRALTVVLLGVTAAALALVVRAWSSAPPDPSAGDDLGRLAAMILIATVLAVVVIGTLYPLFRGWFGGDRLAIEGRFFSGTVAPVALLGALALVGRGRRPPGWAWSVTSIAVVGLELAGWRDAFPVALAAAGIAALVGSAVRLTQTRRPSELAHVGFALLLIGIAGTATGAETTVAVPVGGRVDLQGHTVVVDALGTEAGPTSTSTAVVAALSVDGTERQASLVAHPDRGVLLAESTLRSTPLADVQVILRNARDGSAVLTVRVSPLQQLVWWGTLVMLVGGLATARRPRQPSPPLSASPDRPRRDRWLSSSAPNVPGVPVGVGSGSAGGGAATTSGGAGPLDRA